MAVFGEYETIGGPWFMSGRHGQIRSYWRATSRVLEEKRVYFIKSLALNGPESSQEPAANAPFLANPEADFFESVKRLQEAYRAQPGLIAPIHASGRTDTEIWYATDLYPRNSLAQFEPSAADLDNTTLAHVVCSVASGCLALQQATGRSHGNLKTTNVLLAGKPEPLRRTPLHLIDPAGSASKSPDPSPPGNAETEVRDLRGIGEIILELVERNPIEGPEDYTLPIEHSGPWKALGRNSRRWLALCNRLLDPELSLDEISLESLVKDFRPRSKRTPVLLTGLSLIVVLAVASYPFWAKPFKQATKTWVGDVKTFVSAHLLVLGGPDGSDAVTESTRPAEPSSRLNTEQATAPPETDNPTSSKSAVDLTEASKPVASIPAKTDADNDLVDSRPRTTSPDPAEIPSPPPAPDSKDTAAAASPKGSQSTLNIPSTAQPVAPLPTNAVGAVSASNSRTQDIDTGAAQVALAPPPREPSGVVAQPPDSVTPPPSSTPPAQTQGAKPQVLPERERVPAQQTGDLQAKAELPRSAWPAPQRTKGAPSQGELAKTGTGNERALAKVEKPVVGPPADMRKLNQQLRELEAKVARDVAIRRDSDLFARVDALETQFAKANQLSGKIKKRFDLLRVNMAKKVPGPPPEKLSIEPFIPPIVGKPPNPGGAAGPGPTTAPEGRR